MSLKISLTLDTQKMGRYYEDSYPEETYLLALRAQEEDEGYNRWLEQKAVEDNEFDEYEEDYDSVRMELEPTNAELF